MPVPLNDMPPTPSMFMFASKATRADAESAVFVAAFATGSKASVSPPQPTSAVALAARQSRERRRRRVMRSGDRPVPGEALSPERGELRAPALRVLSELGRGLDRRLAVLLRRLL